MATKTRRRWFAYLAGLTVLALCWHWMDALGDTFWYVAVGRLVLEQGALPSSDPFTFTAGDTPWTLLMPGSYLLFALIERYLGLWVLLLFCAAVEASAWLLVWTRAKSAAARWALLPLVMVGVWLQRDDLAARGQVFGDLGFALLLVLLLDCTRAKVGRKRLRALWALPLSALWVNLHPSELLGLLLPPLFALGLVIEARNIDGRVRAVLLVWAGCLVGSLANPYGAALPIEHVDLALRASTRRIDLFLAPDFRRIDVWIVFLAAAGTFLWLLRQRGARTARLLLLLGLSLAALSGRRYLPLLAMASVALCGHGCRLRVTLPVLQRPAAGVALFLALGALSAWSALTPKDPLKHVPAASVRYMREQGLEGRVFNPYHFGGYLDYALGPRGRVFIDGRNHLFDAGPTFAAHDTITWALPGFDALLEMYGVRTVLAERGSPLARALARHPGFELRFSESIAEVFVRPRRKTQRESRPE